MKCLLYSPILHKNKNYICCSNYRYAQIQNTLKSTSFYGLIKALKSTCCTQIVDIFVSVLLFIILDKGMFKQLLKILILFTVIFSPLITLQYFVTQEADQKPTFVFNLQPQTEGSETKLLIFASWSMFSSSMDEDVILSGMTDTSCSLSGNNSGDGRILLLDTNRHQCR